jgi:hypothetical protein
MHDARAALLPAIADRHLAAMRRIHGDGVLPSIFEGAVSDIAFLDLMALERARLIRRVRRGHYRGYRVTEAGCRILEPRGALGQNALDAESKTYPQT